MRTLISLSILLLFGLAISLPSASGQTVRCMGLGQVLPADCPLPHWFPTDPAMDITLIPTDADTISGFSSDEARRYVRIYFPRTREVLADYEFFLYPDANLQPLTDIQVGWLTDVILEDGRAALITMGGGMNSPEGNVWFTWLGTTLAELLPVRMDPTMKRPNSDFCIEVTRQDPPVLSMFEPLGIEKVVGFHYTTLFEKQATDVWAMVKPAAFAMGTTPWLVSISYGGGEGRKGSFWAVADDIDHGWWWYLHHAHSNPYSFDVLVNVILHATGRRLPDNIEIVHAAREEFRNYNDRKYVLVSIMEFVEMFGGNVRRIETLISELDEVKSSAEGEYLEQNFDEAFDLLKQAGEMNSEARVEAMKIKDQALLYVYIVEWLAVTGTLLVSGSLVYSLMVRRSMYREVATTGRR